MWPRIVLLFNLLALSEAFVTPCSTSTSTSTTTRFLDRPHTALNAAPRQENNLVASTLLATTLALAVALNPLPVQAYESSDYASDTVQEAVQKLKQASGNTEESMNAYEDIAAIISEGRGVGGMVNYSEFRLIFRKNCIGDLQIILSLLTSHPVIRLFCFVLLDRGNPVG
jgi:hypothetical protein